MPELEVSCLTTVPSGAVGIDAVQCLFPAREIYVRDLISLAVVEQCRQLRQRYENDLAQAKSRLQRQYLSQREIEAQAAQGRVSLTEPEPRAAQELDTDAEIACALRGFDAKCFMVLVGTHRCTSLDEVVTLELNQPVHFIRTVPLTGG